MFRLLLAIKAFFRAFSDPKAMKNFLEGKNEKEAKGVKQPEIADLSHLRLLSLMQQTSRLIDFLKEDIAPYNDAQVGAAVRKIHDDCNKCLEDLVTLRPVMEEKEGAKILVPQGYDSTKIKVVGRVKGEPPFEGILVHKGWKASKRSLPKTVGELSSDIIAPAEVEIR